MRLGGDSQAGSSGAAGLARSRSGSRLLPGFRSGASSALIGLVRAYQLLLSPLLGGACRFHPSCSEYAIAVIEREGPVRGTWSAAGRVLRCSPLSAGGLDLP